MKRVLLTGATGFVGRHCLPTLLMKSYEVHAVSSRLRPGRAPDVRWHEADLLDPVQSSKLMEKIRPTHLLHLAWYTVPGKYWTSPENVRWLQASLELLRLFVQRGGRRAVLAGTCAEYDWRYGYCSEAVTPIRPATLYGTCKHSLQLAANALAEEAGLSAAWGRVFFLYGPHEYPERLVPSVILRMIRGERVPCSHAAQIRDFLYVEDIADAFVALLESDARGAINIGSGRPVSLRDVIHKIADRLNGHELVDFGVLPAAGEPPLLLADVSRLAKEVGWLPRYSLDEGIERAVEWWKSRVQNEG